MRVICVLLVLLYAHACSLVHSQQYSEPDIRINQIGFLTSGHKQAVVVSPTTNVFEIKDDSKEVVYKGYLLPTKYWDKSGEEVAIADFSGFKKAGKYVLVIGGTESKPFKIDENPFHGLIKSASKSFYFHRASTALEEEYSGVFKRAYAHPDTAVIIHSSGASNLRPSGYTLPTPYGWYDAGDYNKYVVNSGISTYTLLMSYLHNTELFDTLKLNIPESSNTLPDILDEALWNIRWMESMQDPDDGGVYHKTTTASFEKFVDPSEATAQRYVVAKGTGATLNFAAVMAKAGSIFKEIDSELSSRLIYKAEKAWHWANEHPQVIYRNPSQVSQDSPAIKTGEYGDREFRDEFLWASVELYLATEDQNYLNRIDLNQIEFRVPNWNSVETLGLISLSTEGAKIPELLRKSASDKLMSLSESLIETWREAPYKVTLNDFRWGSNSVVLNQGMVLINAYKSFGNTEFFEAALSGLDYVLGRNAVGYCFVTGMGHRSPASPHHRISASDGIDEPIPGMLVGGPNPHNVEQDCGKDRYGDTLFPAKCYIDEVCSFSTNEVAINWNAPLVYMSSSLQTIYQKELSKN
ncbi:MAG: glycoside hydrolase family 9 protein [Cyclobacteriaceae bacterium]|nr:glycoside hydrolase family 9 protein [Cyclobacteriaceae bacterium SS2]